MGHVSTDEPPARALGPAQQIACLLDDLEVGVYRTLSIRAAVEDVVAGAREQHLAALVVRARLLLTDIDSRSGDTEAALAAQLLLHREAVELGQDALARRASTYLASTYNRLGNRHQAMTAARDAIQDLDRDDGDPDPPTWRAEALMVMTLMSMSRPGADVELVARALDAVRRHCPPTLIAATEANFAEVAAEIGRPELAGELARSATQTLLLHPAAEAVLTWESIALGRAASGDLSGAVRAIRHSLRIEPALGVSDSNGDPWLTSAELFSAQGMPGHGLEALDSPRRSLIPSMRTQARDLRVRGQLLAGLERWQEAYEALAEHVDVYERLRSFEGDRYVERIESRVVAGEERARARQFEHLAITDALTGVPNRRGIEQWLDEAVIVGDAALAVAIVDADHFKMVNDRFSHDVGDRVLRRLSDCLVEAAPGGASRSHLVGRLGGEEFVMVWPVTSPDDARTSADRVRQRVADLSMEAFTPGMAVTVSIGVTVVTERTELKGSPRPALVRADAALYAAKAAGRNAVHQG